MPPEWDPVLEEGEVQDGRDTRAGPEEQMGIGGGSQGKPLLGGRGVSKGAKEQGEVVPQRGGGRPPG